MARVTGLVLDVDGGVGSMVRALPDCNADLQTIVFDLTSFPGKQLVYI